MNTIVCNTLTGAVSEYTRHGFQSVTPTHAGAANGLFAFGGDTDNGLPIVAEIRLPATLRESTLKKSIQMAYLSMTGGGSAEFIVHYREHLRIEEVDLMPIARRVLPRSEWALIEQQFRERPDPLQADAGALDAPALLRRITALAPAPLGYGPAAH